MKFCPHCQRQYPAGLLFCMEDGSRLSLHDPYNFVGTTLADKFWIAALAGLGGMGAVYSARQLTVDRNVAFKILQPNLALGDKRMLALFEQEARLSGRITHENVAVVYDAGLTSDGIAYMVMEWLQGRTLEDELAEHGPLSFTRTGEILRQVAAALDAAHQSNIVHRDLKPANIMLVQQSATKEQVKVLDFGIGKVMDEKANVLVSQMVGTPHYASPEQLIPGSPIDGRADLYSLGVMLYQMLTGKLPFDSTSIFELLRMHLDTPPPPLRELRQDAPVELEQLILRLLSKDPSGRPERAGDIPGLFEEACATTNQVQTGNIQPLPTQPISAGSTVPNRGNEINGLSLSAQEGKEKWEYYSEKARKNGQQGSLMLLAEEAPDWELRFAAHRRAGNALLKLGNLTPALAQYEKALQYNPADVESRRQKGVTLGRLGRRDEAKEWLRKLISDHPDDAHTWGLLGRIEKEEWIQAWREERKSSSHRRQSSAAENLLRGAIEAYLIGFQLDPSDYYPGINALTLFYLLEHLTGKPDLLTERSLLVGGVRWAIHCALKKEADSYWARATLGEFEVLTGEQSDIEEAWQKAVAAAKGDWFALDSSQQQLMLLKEAAFRPQEVEIALRILDGGFQQTQALQESWKLRNVYLFSGHMIDRADRAEPRFPANKEDRVAAAIAQKIDELGGGPEDLAMCGGACGGDLLFAEACLRRGLRLEVRLPFDEMTFLNTSVTYAGEGWRDRFYQVVHHPNTKLMIMPEEIGPTPEDKNPYARNNQWMLYSALALGPEKVRLICLWDGKEGDGPGGTKHMIETVSAQEGQTYVLDVNQLW